MEPDEILKICLAKKCAYLDYPFGETPACARVGGRIFAQVYKDKVTLKCEPVNGDFYKRKYPGTVTRGYFCPPVQQPYWITVYLNGQVPDGELCGMIDEAYRAAVKKLPKKAREALFQASADRFPV